LGARRAHCKYRDFCLSCARTAETIDLPFGLWTRVGRRKHRFNRIRQVAPMCPHGKAHWRHLSNTIEPSVCGGDVVLCQIRAYFDHLSIFWIPFLRLEWVDLRISNLIHRLIMASRPTSQVLVSINLPSKEPKDGFMWIERYVPPFLLQYHINQCVCSDLLHLKIFKFSWEECTANSRTLVVLPPLAVACL